MSESEQKAAEREIMDLRRRGLITPGQAYERHLALLGHATGVATAPATRATVSSQSAPAWDRPGPGLYLLGVALAIFGGLLGVIGAVVQELRSGIGLVFIGAPLIEEAMKPAGIYILLLKWPRALAGQLHVALLCALSGLCFGVVESLLYVKVYFPDASGDLVLYRFTVTLALHAGASFIVGLGLSRAVIDWAAGRSSFPPRTRNFYAAAVALHALYNTLVVAFSLAGWLDFGD